MDPVRGSRTVRRTIALQGVTIGWMLMECGVALLAAVRAHSLPVAAFGADSLVELMSATVVLLQFGGRFRVSPRAAARTASVLLVLLAVVIAALAVEGARLRLAPERSLLGIGITLAALVVMPVLAVLKRRHARATGDVAMAADAVQSATCAWLAAVTLLSLLLQAIHPRWWIDSLAMAVLLPLLLTEAWRAWKGNSCGCC